MKSKARKTVGLFLSLILGYCLSYSVQAQKPVQMVWQGKSVSGYTKTETVTMRLQDVPGRTLMQEEISLKEGMNTVRLHTGNLSEGIYMFSIVSDDQSAALKLFISGNTGGGYTEINFKKVTCLDCGGDGGGGTGGSGGGGGTGGGNCTWQEVYNEFTGTWEWKCI